MNQLQKNNNVIANWLQVGIILVLIMVLIGGITRLTHSGLSIVTWQPIKGILPPLNEQQWQDAFEAYKKIPEYQKVHHYFTLNDFKKIYFWEYVHRILGRLLGLIFFIPFLYFLVANKIKSKKLLRRLLLIFLLGGIQGFAGWYMVKSGLLERTSVDHYRLALHMTIALTVISVIYWTLLQLKFPRVDNHFPGTHRLLIVSIVLLILQIIYGGFTAGLKAGYVFPTFPKMGHDWFPAISVKMWKESGMASFFEFPATVQFTHRWFGLFLTVMILFILFFSRKKLPSVLKKVFLLISFLISLQYLLGVWVIIYKVPIFLAVTHQINAFLLFLAMLTAVYFSMARKNIFD